MRPRSGRQGNHDHATGPGRSAVVDVAATPLAGDRLNQHAITHTVDATVGRDQTMRGGGLFADVDELNTSVSRRHEQQDLRTARQGRSQQ